MYDQLNASDPEELITCPYMQVHQVTRKRMQKHLIGCRDLFMELAKDLVTCPFHIAHRVPRTEIEVHKQICSHRDSLYSHTFVVAETTNAVLDSMKNAEVELFVPGDESWDVDEEEPSGSVHQTLEKLKDERTDIYRNYQNMIPSERKAKREEDRLKELARTNEEEEATKSEPRNQQTSSAAKSAPSTTANKAPSTTANRAPSTASSSVVSASIHNAPQSSAMSDSSFNTALSEAASRLEEFQLVTKKGRGRGKATPPEKPNSLAGVGRGRRLNN